jgi:glycosyltransferase involved in cell wall biosynthesis
MAIVATTIKPRHVVWITSGFAADENDSTCIPTLQDLALELTKDPDIRLSIVALHYPPAKKEYLWHGIAVYALGGKNRKGWKRLQTGLNLFSLLRKLDQSLSIQVLHSFWLADTSVWTLLWNFSKRKKHLLTLMGQDSLGKWYDRFLPFHRMQCFALSDFAAEKFFQATGRRVAVNPFGLPEADLPFVPQREIHLLSVGAIIPLKNHLYFLQILKILKTEMKSLRALIIGEQHDTDELRRLNTYIEENHLEETVSILPKMSREEVKQWMARSICLVHCANFESQGMVMQEAMQMGCKVFSAGAGIRFEITQFQSLSGNTTVDAALLHRFLLSGEEIKPVNIISIAQTANSYKENYR